MQRERFPEFGPIWKARFLERPNRFLLRCRSRTLGTIEAHLPNPGRMAELLIPGATVHLTAPPASRSKKRKTKYTVLAIDRAGVPVFLHTHLTNAVARRLIEERRVPGLKQATIVRAEVPVGRSRFDFQLQDRRGNLYLEVKSCTLFGNRVALFPDAVTERGRRHLLELAALAQNGIRTAVLFIVHSPDVDQFMPDYHTDLAFARTLLAVRRHVRILPVTVQWTPDLQLGPSSTLLPIPWAHIKKEAADRGSYIAILHLEKKQTIPIGQLGPQTFRPGHYLYIGSAMNGLDARMARHRRKTKKKNHWHIDYLRPHAAHFDIVPIRSSRRLECAIAAALAQILDPGPARFGSTDCHCFTHLLYSRKNPLHRPDFHTALEPFRMPKIGTLPIFSPTNT